MKTKMPFITVLAFIFVSCSPPPIVIATQTSTITATQTPVLPTVTSTITATPSKTPFPELTVADIGLLWNPEEINGHVQIMPCYLFTSTMFHAGDGFYFPPGSRDTIYNVIAPADGKITHAGFINDAIGWEINIQTPYLLDGKPVYYDIVHTSGLVAGLTEGSFVRKGDNLAIKKNEHLDPIGKWIVDIGFRIGEKQANASLPEWTGLGYFSYTALIEDDLKQLLPSQFCVPPKCAGNRIQQDKPYATPTLGGFTYP